MLFRSLLSVTYCTDHSLKSKCSFAAMNIIISKTNELKEVIMSVNAKDLDVDFVLQFISVENEADEESGS